MDRNTRARISSALLLLLASSLGAQLLQDVRQSHALRCAPGVEGAPADTPKLADGRGVVPFLATARRVGLEPVETVRRLSADSPTRAEIDSGALVRLAGRDAGARAAITTQRTADPIIRAALRGADASPIRGPPDYS